MWEAMQKTASFSASFYVLQFFAAIAAADLLELKSILRAEYGYWQTAW